MNRIYLLLTIAVVLSMPLQAQLSGTVTIDDGAPSSATNYTSFSSLAFTLNAAGINGPLVVNVMPGSGPYNEQVEFTQVQGVSAMNKIVVNGNGCVLLFGAGTSAMPWVLRLNGTDRLHINNLDVIGTGNYAYCCDLVNGAEHNNFSACNFSAAVTGTAAVYQVPVTIGRINGTTLVAGNHNKFTHCNMSGGYAGIVDWSTTSPPFNNGNLFSDCHVTDFYYYGLLARQTRNLAVKFCTFDRPTRSMGLGAVYGMYIYGADGSLIEGNTIQNLTGSAPTFTGATHGIFSIYHTLPSGVAPSVYRNNIISCLSSHGTTYGMYTNSLDAHILHNTVYIDDQSAPTLTSTTFGMYILAAYDDSTRVKNNLVWLSRAGVGQEFGMYYDCGRDLISDYNVIYLDLLGQNHYTAYLCGVNTLAQLQGQNSDMHSFNIDPLFSPGSGCRPLPTSTVINNQAAPLAVMLDANQAWRNMQAPDIGALESLAGPCSGTPSNSIVGPFTVCPGTSFDLLTGLNNNFSGLTLSWKKSNSSSGPFVAIPNANSVMYNEGAIFADTYYQAVLTCTLPGGGSSTSGFTVQVAGPTFDTVPYFEHFEALGKNDALPNCSWSASDLGNANQTYTLAVNPGRFAHAGSGFASFFNIAPGHSQFYSNGIYIKAGVTYSAAVWYNRDNSSASNFTNISLFYATSQNSTAITNIQSITPVASSTYQLLDGTFTVASTGTYYVGVGAASTYSTASFLLLDDLSVTIPCTGTGSGLNGVNLAIAGTSVVCQGQGVLLSASGADVYQWATGPGTQTFFVTPAVTTTYNVSGTNTLSGCAANLGYAVVVQNCTGADEVHSQVTRVYPSPFSDELIAEWQAPAKREIILSDVSGRLVYSGSTEDMELRIPTAHLAKGVYFLVVRSGAHSATQKVIKQ